MQSVLEQHTSAYWRVSKSWNQQSDEGLTIEDALNITSEICDDLGPHRKLVSKSASLQNDIIIGNEPGKKRARK